jgi:hypothetical protein
VRPRLKASVDVAAKKDVTTSDDSHERHSDAGDHCRGEVATLGDGNDKGDDNVALFSPTCRRSRNG